jgi:hypothetical protein
MSALVGAASAPGVAAARQRAGCPASRLVHSGAATRCTAHGSFVCSDGRSRACSLYVMSAARAVQLFIFRALECWRTSRKRR